MSKFKKKKKKILNGVKKKLAKILLLENDIFLDIWIILVKIMVKETLTKMDRSKMTCPKWNFGQVEQGSKKTKVGARFFCQNFLVK